MSHSTWIALAIASLFLVYVTMRGHLGQYLATVLGPFPAAETGSTPKSSGGGPSSGSSGGTKDYGNAWNNGWAGIGRGLGIWED